MNGDHAKIYDKIGNVDTKVNKIDKQLSVLNNKFDKMAEERKTRKTDLDILIGKMYERIDWNRSKILIAYGAIAMLGLFGTLKGLSII